MASSAGRCAAPAKHPSTLAHARIQYNHGIVRTIALSAWHPFRAPVTIIMMLASECNAAPPQIPANPMVSFVEGVEKALEKSSGWHHASTNGTTPSTSATKAKHPSRVIKFAVARSECVRMPSQFFFAAGYENWSLEENSCSLGTLTFSSICLGTGRFCLIGCCLFGGVFTGNLERYSLSSRFEVSLLDGEDRVELVIALLFLRSIRSSGQPFCLNAKPPEFSEPMKILCQSNYSGNFERQNKKEHGWCAFEKN